MGVVAEHGQLQVIAAVECLWVQQRDRTRPLCIQHLHMALTAIALRK
jgi:hypothetical protein